MTHLLLLAAGMGKRIGDLTAGAPKVMLGLPTGRSLLAENLCNALGSRAVERATVITGHLAELVDREVRLHERAERVQTVHNPLFASAGPVRSLWQAREIIGTDDVLIVNGDTFYQEEAFASFVRGAGQGLFLAFSRSGQEADDVKVALRPDGSLAAVGKSLPAERADGISAGMLLVSGERARARFAATLAAFTADGRTVTRGVIWHDLVNELASVDEGVGAVEIEPSLWREVDTPADYEALCATLR